MPCMPHMCIAFAQADRSQGCSSAKTHSALPAIKQRQVASFSHAKTQLREWPFMATDDRIELTPYIDKWDWSRPSVSVRLRGRRAVVQRRRRLDTEPLCRHCLEQGRYTQPDFIDHIVPLSKGGTDHDSNTQALCAECHDIKTREDFAYKTKRTIGEDGWPI
jgi:5-methylcytosine-specific restriction protein A